MPDAVPDPDPDSDPGTGADPDAGMDVDVLVVGGGQAGLAAAYHLRRAGRRFVVLDAAREPGGAWQHGWDSLRLFSPAEHSSLPGWRMPVPAGGPAELPDRDHVVDYLTRYERRYGFDVRRPVRVLDVVRDPTGGRLRVLTTAGTWHARTVVSATGTWTRPFVPAYPGVAGFRGRQLHTVGYRRPDDLAGRRVLVVGGGNSAAQLLAEVSTVADTTWVTPRPPRFLPDDVDGRVLFSLAGARPAAGGGGRIAGLGDIVVVPSVKQARARGALGARPPFRRLLPDGVEWADGSRDRFDVVLWCTGFRPALGHLRGLRLPRAGEGPETEQETRAVAEPRLRLLGYGDWTGHASATLVGAGRTAKATVAALDA